ncbi:MAG: hypothetical protein U0794_10365 [Isosphaeraceae bacterium]
MARCDEGYRCEVCGGDVDGLPESDLYLRYVLGEVDPDTLHNSPERHIRCNPVLAQFIVAEGFDPVAVEGPFTKSALDPEFVREEEARVTRGYRRLLELPSLGVPITEYPFPEARARWSEAASDDPPADRDAWKPR